MMQASTASLALFLHELRTIAAQLVTDRVEGNPTPVENSLAAAAPLLALLHALNRNSYLFIKQSKITTAKAKLEMDAINLQLQNLLYERSHFEKEIINCQDFE